MSALKVFLKSAAWNREMSRALPIILSWGPLRCGMPRFSRSCVAPSDFPLPLVTDGRCKNEKS